LAKRRLCLPYYEQREPLLAQGEWEQKATEDSLSGWQGEAEGSWHWVLSCSVASKEQGQRWAGAK